MDMSLVGPLVLYSFICCATPGPNNVMLASSGLLFGFRRTIPHMLGISGGTALMLMLSGLGLGVAFEAMPSLRRGVQIAGALYLGWLAFRLWKVGDLAGKENARPFRFWQGAAFQFINPKAWAITMPAIAGFTVVGKPLGIQLITLIAVFTMVGLPSIAAWAALGAGAREWLSNREAMVLFARIMSILTALTALLFLM